MYARSYYPPSFFPTSFFPKTGGRLGGHGGKVGGWYRYQWLLHHARERRRHEQTRDAAIASTTRESITARLINKAWDDERTYQKNLAEASMYSVLLSEL